MLSLSSLINTETEKLLSKNYSASITKELIFLAGSSQKYFNFKNIKQLLDDFLT